MDGLRRYHRAGRGGGFTLIELLVVISIIALLISLLLPSLGLARASGKRAQAAAQLKGIGTAMHNYAADNSGWFPYESAVTFPDNPTPLAGGGVNIYGMMCYATKARGLGAYAPFDANGDGVADKAYGPVGLGVLAMPGQYATGANLTEHRPGGYLPVEMLFSPELLLFRRNHANNNWGGQLIDPVQYFGYKGAVFDGSSLPLDPGGWWWSNAGTYGNYYMGGSYAYRHGHRGKWSGKTGNVEANHNTQWTVDGVATTQDMDIRYVRESHPKNVGVSIVAEGPGLHPQLKGGNYLLTDGSGHWFGNEYYSNGYYQRSNHATTLPNGTGNPLYGTCAGIGGDVHSGIHQNLIFGAIDRHRNGLKVPGTDGVSGFDYAGD